MTTADGPWWPSAVVYRVHVPPFPPLDARVGGDLGRLRTLFSVADDLPLLWRFSRGVAAERHAVAGVVLSKKGRPRGGP
jgi:hypothetical protein